MIPSERFLTKVSVPSNKDENVCWEWRGPKTVAGYGMFTIGRSAPGQNPKTAPAHRFAYELLTGQAIDQGLELDHLCANPSCVRPSHLEPVTHAENVRRSQERRGYFNPVIVDRYVAGEPATAIARDLGISHVTVLARVREAGVAVRRVGRPSTAKALAS